MLLSFLIIVINSTENGLGIFCLFENQNIFSKSYLMMIIQKEILNNEQTVMKSFTDLMSQFRSQFDFSKRSLLVSSNIYVPILDNCISML